MLEALFPRELEMPQATIRLRNRGALSGPAISIRCHHERSRGGEYAKTVVIPWNEGAARNQALLDLSYEAGRWVEIEMAIRSVLAEREACDADGNGNWVDDDMTVPAWRYHCPLPLREAMDMAGMDSESRRRIVTTSDSFQLLGRTITVHEVEGELCGRMLPSVKRISISSPGVVFSQGVVNCRMKVDQVFPEMTLGALLGKPVRYLIDLPGLRSDHLVIQKIHLRPKKMETIFEISRRFSFLDAACDHGRRRT